MAEKSTDPCCDCNECDCCPTGVPEYYRVTISGSEPTAACTECDNFDYYYGLWQIPCVPCGWYYQGSDRCDHVFPACSSLWLIELDFSCEVVAGEWITTAWLQVQFAGEGMSGEFVWKKVRTGVLDCYDTLAFTSADLESTSGTPACDLSTATLTVTATDSNPCAP